MWDGGNGVEILRGAEELLVGSNPHPPPMDPALEHSPNKTKKKQQKAFTMIVLFTTIVGSLVYKPNYSITGNRTNILARHLNSEGKQSDRSIKINFLLI